jgi:hypothetical protein
MRAIRTPSSKLFFLRGSQEKSLVDFMHATDLWNIHPGITRDRDQCDRIVDRIDVDYHGILLAIYLFFTA